MGKTGEPSIVRPPYLLSQHDGLPYCPICYSIMCHVAIVKYPFRQFYAGTPVQSAYPPVQIYLHLLDNLPHPLSAIFSPSGGNLHLSYCPFNAPFYPHRSPPIRIQSISSSAF